MSATAQTVPFGPYFGFTLNELKTELARYKEARKLSHSRLATATISGQSYGYGSRTDGNLDEWQNDIQVALYWLDPGLYPFPPPTNAAALFSA